MTNVGNDEQGTIVRHFDIRQFVIALGRRPQFAWVFEGVALDFPFVPAAFEGVDIGYA